MKLSLAERDRRRGESVVRGGSRGRALSPLARGGRGRPHLGPKATHQLGGLLVAPE